MKIRNLKLKLIINFIKKIIIKILIIFKMIIVNYKFTLKNFKSLNMILKYLILNLEIWWKTKVKNKKLRKLLNNTESVAK